MSKTNEIGSHKTSVFTLDDGALCVVYHNTSVVKKKPDGSIELNTGGWRTATTKLRMNQASNQFGLGYCVYQKDFDWYVRSINGTVLRFDEQTLILPVGWK